MPGPKQHHIPQCLLREFGRQKKGKKAVQVTVYARDRVFTTATDGVAAQRYFYSGPDVDTEETSLDDKITAYESELAVALEELRAAPAGSAVDAEMASEAVTHLCARAAPVRQLHEAVLSQMTQGFQDVIRSKERLWKFLGLDAETPNEHLRKAGIEGSTFTNLKANFDVHFAAQLSASQTGLGSISDQAPEMARRGHNQALDQSLVPEGRAEVLRELAWRVEHGPDNGFLLPDCVVINLLGGTDCRPFILTGKDDIGTILMPLSHNRLLVGDHKEATLGPPEAINKLFAACSHDAFIARVRAPEFEQLMPSIREIPGQLVEGAVRPALDKL